MNSNSEEFQPLTAWQGRKLRAEIVKEGNTIAENPNEADFILHLSKWEELADELIVSLTRLEYKSLIL